MKLSFRLAHRLGLGLLAGCLAWSVWAAVPENTDTNVTAVAGSGQASESGYLTFGLDQVSYLQGEFPKGFPLWQYVASLIYILMAFVVSKGLDYFARVYFKRWTERTRTQLDDLLLAILKGPVKIVSFVVLLHLGLHVFQWPEVIELFLSKVLIVVVACSITYMVVKVIDVLLAFWKRRSEGETDRAFDEQLFPVIRRALQVFVIVVAVLLTSQNLGLNITSLIASLSIGGLALGLAAQDTLGNMFGAVSVFMDKPFRIGDRVQLNGMDGTVEEIGLRSTRIRNLDGHLITVPNKTMGSATITNVTRRPNIKTVMNIGITYDTSTEKVKEAIGILEEIYRKHPMTFDVIISFNQFAESALNIQVVHWWNSTVQKDYLKGMQEMNLAVKERFDAARIGFAFPSRTLYVKQDSDWRLAGMSENRTGY